MLIKHIKSKLFTLDYNKETSIKKRVFNLLRCNIVRLVLIGKSVLCIYYLISNTSYFSWYFLTLCFLAILIDTFWVSIKRKGQEWCWFSVSNFAYTIVLLTTIIELVYVKCK